MAPPLEGNSIEQLVDIVKTPHIPIIKKGTKKVIFHCSQAAWVKMLAFLHIDQVTLDKLPQFLHL